MSLTLTVNGEDYEVPTTGEPHWRPSVATWEKSVTDGMIQKSGGTMTGPLILSADPLVNLGAATKQYVDNSIAGSLSVTDSATIDFTLTLGNLTGIVKTNSISNTHIASAAAIAVNKLAALTVSRAVASDSSGFLTASATTSTELGYVSGVTSAIQTQINNKFTLPALTSGSVLFSNGTTIAQDNANLFWDDTNNRLGIGTASPQWPVHLKTPSGTNSYFFSDATDATGAAGFLMGNSGTYKWYIQTMGSGTSDSFSLTNASSSPKIYVKQDGSVGIGTTNPVGLLHVKYSGDNAAISVIGNGTYATRIGSAAGGNYIDGVDTTAFGSYQPLTIGGSVVNLAIGSGNVLTVSSGSNVGIGTESPSFKLHVKAVSGGGFVFADNSAAISPSGYLYGSNGTYKWYTENSGSGDGHSWYLVNESGSVKISVLQNGKVGIGPIVPSYNLDVTGNARATTYLYIGDRTQTYAGYVGAVIGASTGGSFIDFDHDATRIGEFYTTSNTFNMFADTGCPIHFYTNGDVSTKVLSLSTAGNVGIGTASPAYNLHVKAPTSGNSFLFSDTTTSANVAGYIYGSAGTYKWYHLNTGSGDSDKWQLLNAGDSPKLTVLQDGKVGIGTSAPLQLLQIGENTAVSTATPSSISLGGSYSSAAGSNLKLRLYDNNAGGFAGIGISSGQMDYSSATGIEHVFYIAGNEYARLATTGVFQVKSGASSGVAKVGGSIFDHYTDANNGTTVETDLYSDTLAASTFGTNGDKIYAEYAGSFVGDATSTQRLKAYFGGTLIFDTGALGIGVTTAFWDLFVTCIRESSSIVRCSVALNTSFATLNSYSTYTKVTGLTLSNTQILKITGTAAGVTGGSNQITASQGYVQWFPAA